MPLAAFARTSAPAKLYQITPLFPSIDRPDQP
jgi:hypothetical protein